MADGMIEDGQDTPEARKPWHMSVEEAREQAKARFRERLANGQQIGGCSCADDEPAAGTDGDASAVVGVRFRDSGRVYFFQSESAAVDVGTWVACTTSRGQEAGRVVVAPKQVVMSQLDGALKPIDRVLDDEDVARIERQRTDAARVVRRAGEIARYYDFGIKPVSAEFALDGASVRVAFSAEDHSFVEDFRAMLVKDFGMDVYLHHVGPRDEARLIGGLGKCGRTLCCSSWLPMYPDVTMGMAKNQDLSLNPTKVSGLCGRLLCCLSYENEQYKKAKQILPRLGQRITTPDGEGMVVSLQVLKELVTVRFADPWRDVVYHSAELLEGRRAPVSEAAPAPGLQEQALAEDQPADRQRRRRRRRKPRDSNDSSSTQN